MMTDKISIRRFDADDWEILKRIRLEAVKAHSDVFLINYEDSLKLEDNYWIETVSDHDKGAVYGLYDGDEVIGLTGVFRHRDSPEDTAIFGMTYIREDYRGKGLSKSLYDTSMSWALAQKGIRRLVISHREGNEESKSSILRAGFKPYSSEEKTYGDGTNSISYSYEKWIDERGKEL
jgi:RimJ/RimL family protein N-acetyltransferase